MYYFCNLIFKFNELMIIEKIFFYLKKKPNINIIIYSSNFKFFHVFYLNS